MLNIENQLRDYMQNDRFKKTLACFIGLNLDLGKPHAQLAINNLQSKLEVSYSTRNQEEQLMEEDREILESPEAAPSFTL